MQETANYADCENGCVAALAEWPLHRGGRAPPLGATKMSAMDDREEWNHR